MSIYILPILLAALFIYCLFKKLNAYNIFVDGAKGALKLVAGIFPYIVCIMIAVALLRLSGITDFLTWILSPIFNILGIPTEVCELVLLRPFSGSGSYAILTDIYTKYGADSYISRCASCIMGSSETIFYVATIYFFDTKIKRLLYTIPLALFASIIGAVVSCLLCSII